MKGHFLFVWVLMLLWASTAAAQTARRVQNLSVLPEIQAEMQLDNNDYLLDYLWFSVRGQRTVSDGDNAAPPRTLGFEDSRLTVGYEHILDAAKWSFGATLRGIQANNSLAVVPELVIRHRSEVDILMFGQRLSFERTFGNENSYVYGGGPQGENWVRLRVDLEKIVPIGSTYLRPRLSYEAATHLRIQKAATDKDERTIQFTSLRGEVGVQLNGRFDCTPWFAYQTTYYTALQQFNAQGQLTSGTRLNVVNPVAGFDLRYRFGSNKLITQSGTEHWSLPTQH